MKWQVKDFADGWIDVADEAAAKKLSEEQSGATVRQKPKLVSHSIRVDPDVWARLGEQANAQNTTRSRLVTAAIHALAEPKGKK